MVNGLHICEELHAKLNVSHGHVYGNLFKTLFTKCVKLLRLFIFDLRGKGVTGSWEIKCPIFDHIL